MDSDVQLVITLLSVAGAVISFIGTLVGRRQLVVVQGQADCAPTARPVPPPSPAPAPTTSPGPAPVKWYDHPGWILFWLLFFWPVGLYALGRSRWIKGSWKTAALAVLGGLFLMGLLA